MNTLDHNNNSFVFIVGSPRSGTTLLGNILDRHEKISQWYEPYFVWDHALRYHPDDQRTEKDVTEKIKNQIYNAFLKYKKRTGSHIIVDKSPRNSLKIPFILEIFPNARFIHLVRDGRDATLSIHKEWIRRRNIVQNTNYKFDYISALTGINSWLKRQTFLSDKIKALWFETHFHLINKSKHLNRIRWKDNVGWGPRFKNWEDVFTQNSLMQFNAYQWLRCVENIIQNWPEIPDDNKLCLKYEELLEGEHNIKKILDFLGVKISNNFLSTIPDLKVNNYNKWQKEFSAFQAKEILHIVTPMLIQLEYDTNYDWPKKISAPQN